MTGESILLEVSKHLRDMKTGFDLSAEDKAMLDQPHLASKHRILSLEEKLPVDIKNELFFIANSPLHTRDHIRKATDFWEVALALGMENIKTYIFTSALFGLAATNRDIRDLKNRSLATAGLSIAIMHNVLGFDLAMAPKARLCGMVSEFGKIPFLVYRQQHADDHAVAGIMTDDFINIHHGRIGLKLIEVFDLPAYLRDLFDKKSLIFFDKDHEFSLTTVVRIAKLMVRDSFKHHGKLVVTSVVDDPHGAVWGSVGTEIQSLFDSLGIGHLLEIIPFETPAQQHARQKKKVP